MSATYCDIHKTEKIVIIGCSAHPDSWYCPECYSVVELEAEVKKWKLECCKWQDINSDLEEKANHWEETCHAQAETLSKAESDCTKLLKENQWQPMDSVPKDGTEILLKVEFRANISGKCLVGHYMPEGSYCDEHPPIAEGWYFWNGYMFDKASKPTHWMKLPDD